LWGTALDDTQSCEWCQDVTSSLPHVAVTVDHAKEVPELRPGFGCRQTANGFHFLWLWLNALVGQLIAA